MSRLTDQQELAARRRRRMMGRSGVTPPPPPVVDPPDVVLGDDLGFWYRGDREVYQDAIGTIPAVGGGPIRYWGDLSGNARHLLSTTTPADFRPLWIAVMSDGRPGVRFDGGSQQMNASFSGGPFAQPWHFFAVFKVNRMANGDTYWDGNSANRMRLYQGDVVGQFQMYSNTYGPSRPIPAGYLLAEALYNGAAGSLIVNGGAPGTGGNSLADLGGLTVGEVGNQSGGNGAMDMLEFLGARIAVTGTQLTDLRAYFHDRYPTVPGI